MDRTQTNRSSSRAVRSTGSRLHPEFLRFLHVFGLAGFAFAQPVLDVFGRSPETFIFRDAETGGIVAFALFAILGPALVIWLATLPISLLWSRRQALVHASVVGGLCLLIALQILKSATPLLNTPLVAAAVAGGALLAFFLLHTSFGKLWLDWSWGGPVAFILLFLLFSPTSKLVRPVEATADQPARARATPVVMVLFDELPLMSILDRNGKINDKLYPNLARLARGSTWYRNYTVTEVRSQYSIPTILTGQLVQERPKYPVFADFPQNLFVLLEPTHRINAIEWLTALCPPDTCSERPEEETLSTLPALLGDAVSVWADRALPGEVTRDILEQFEDEPVLEDEDEITKMLDERKEYSRRHPAQLEGFAPFLEGITDEGPPTLHFLHARPPHSPWVFYPSGKRYENMRRPVGRTNPTSWQGGGWPLELHRLRHLLSVQYVDRLVGLLVRQLEEVGVYNETLLVVTSDHGVSFAPGGSLRALTEENLHEVSWVPLFIKQPGQRRGITDDRNLSAPDLLPTIADILGFEAPWETDGASALDPKWDRGPVKTLTGHQDGLRYPWPDREFSIELETAQRRLREGIFRPADPSLDVKLWPYSIGPASHLVGRKISDLPQGPEATYEVKVEDAEAFDEVNLASSEVPGLVRGDVSSDDAAVVVVALNGRIAGASTVFSDGDDDRRFAVLIPDFFFRNGSNDLQLFQLDGSILRPIDAD